MGAYRFCITVTTALFVLFQSSSATATTCKELAARCKSPLEVYSVDQMCETVMRDVLSSSNNRICAPRDKPADVQRAFVRWANNHPKLGKVDAEECMREALAESYRCH